MDGPPPDPRMVPLDVGLLNDPLGTGICLGVAALAAVAAWRSRRPSGRMAWLTVAVVVAFTCPWLVWVDRAWFGDFPTIDKEGSLLFFLDGVHQRLYSMPWRAPSDDAIRLIGVHAGHLWVTEALAVVVSPMGAFNAQWLLQLGVAWGAASWAIHEAVWARPGGRAPSAQTRWAAWVAGFPFGMGLHMFRDLNWTTVEKGGVGFIAAFVGLWLRATRRGGRWLAYLAVCYAAMALYNLYFAVVCAFFGALHLATSLWSRSPEGRRRMAAAVGVCAAVGVPIAVAQLLIQAGGPALASPERFLWERAALDGFTLVPLQWNRLEVWRACNPVMLGLAGVGLYQLRRFKPVARAATVATALFVVALGPVLIPGPTLSEPTLVNPIYMALHTVLPGFWRLAKPEVFFEPVWLMVLGAGAVGLHHLLTHKRAWGLVAGGLVFVVWWPLVRQHASFPGLSAPLDSALDPRWQQRVFDAPPPTADGLPSPAGEEQHIPE